MLKKSNYIKNGLIAGALSLPLLFGGCYKVIHPVEGQRETTITSIVKEMHPKSLESIIKKESKKFHEELTDKELTKVIEDYNYDARLIMENDYLAIYGEEQNLYYNVDKKGDKFEVYAPLKVSGEDFLAKIEFPIIYRDKILYSRLYSSVFEVTEKSRNIEKIMISGEAPELFFMIGRAFKSGGFDSNDGFKFKPVRINFNEGKDVLTVKEDNSLWDDKKMKHYGELSPEQREQIYSGF